MSGMEINKGKKTGDDALPEALTNLSDAELIAVGERLREHDSFALACLNELSSTSEGQELLSRVGFGLK